ncbi:DMT family transporter [Simiduia agarivorans]|uniref:Permease of the drug/metabolite transporter superfamily protein n=1 Tax=Simiduia agarivorans (strain DSM 21679 / JCM 13881 / BCRC 17597 / SA1) TaxID=1117647 RepID=K4KK54_SIMAS|nr:DMT family transporter [Simiduia agarivorans]AFU99381.1 permease of the drug/metabolite transporter superfamily protein [Simiduia agarivorans SA1 = DSM 21679]
MPATRVWLLTAIAMLAFAANSLLCRMALAQGHIDPASFTALRLIAGAVMLALLVSVSAKPRAPVFVQGSWRGAFALFIYAAGFSFAYVELNTATGALILFAAVQLCMIAFGLWQGERFSALQWAGLVCALAGLAYLLVPNATRPDLWSALLMAAAGVAWAVYSLLGKQSRGALFFTAGNFVKSLVFAAPLLWAFNDLFYVNAKGVALAIASGALASGMGYALWYALLPHLKAMTAASVQLSVPVLAALMGVVVLSEPLSLSLVLASIAVLAGVGLVICRSPR